MYDLIKAMKSGQLIIYPTETLYALGCDAYDVDAGKAVIDIKSRPSSKPLPMIIGGMEMLSMVTDDFSNTMKQLAADFWPGPLSILVKALPDLPGHLSDSEGYTSVRWSGHPFASELSKRLQRPIVSTSANLKGKEPASLPEDIDPVLIEKAGAVYTDPPWPKGGKASSVIRVLSATRLEVIREGAVSVKMLCDKGFSVTLAK